MVKKKNKILSRDETIDLLKSLGKGAIELSKSGVVPRYTLTTLGLYLLGRTCLFPCSIISSIHGINTIMAVSEVTEDTGTFSGLTNGVLSGSSGIAAGILMNDTLAQHCKKCESVGTTIHEGKKRSVRSGGSKIASGDPVKGIIEVVSGIGL